MNRFPPSLVGLDAAESTVLMPEQDGEVEDVMQAEYGGAEESELRAEEQAQEQEARACSLDAEERVDEAPHVRRRAYDGLAGERVVACEFAEFGCPALVRECDMESHLEEEARTHLELVLGVLQVERSQRQLHGKAMSFAQKRCRILSSENARLREGMARMKRQQEQQAQQEARVKAVLVPMQPSQQAVLRALGADSSEAQQASKLRAELEQTRQQLASAQERVSKLTSCLMATLHEQAAVGTSTSGGGDAVASTSSSGESSDDLEEVLLRSPQLPALLPSYLPAVIPGLADGDGADAISRLQRERKLRQLGAQFDPAYQSRPDLRGDKRLDPLQSEYAGMLEATMRRIKAQEERERFKREKLELIAYYKTQTREQMQSLLESTFDVLANATVAIDAQSQEELRQERQRHAQSQARCPSHWFKRLLGQAGGVEGDAGAN